MDDLTNQGLDVLTQGLEGLGGGDDSAFTDLDRTVSDAVRARQAGRGLFESDFAGIEEGLALSGARERFRAGRLAQAAPFLGSGLSSAARGQRNFNIMGQFVPSAGGLLQGQLQSRGLRLGADRSQQELSSQADLARGQLIGTGIGLVGSIGTGGAFGALGGAGFGSGALQGAGSFFGLPGLPGGFSGNNAGVPGGFFG